MVNLLFGNIFVAVINYSNKIIFVVKCYLSHQWFQHINEANESFLCWPISHISMLFLCK